MIRVTWRLLNADRSGVWDVRFGYTIGGGGRIRVGRGSTRFVHG
jgi:hypothetical protein